MKAAPPLEKPVAEAVTLPAVSVENVGKTYAIWTSPMARLRGRAWNFLGALPLLSRGWSARLRARGAAGRRDFHALRGVTFQVRRGQSVGIVGRNGSGKSTLLQIIAATLRPSEGRTVTRGRVVALLELASGFNAEFTGRANVLINAAILGLSRRQIAERFEQIAAFAEIGDFMEQPVKNYSSGMMLRLAFAVSVHLDPEILIIDEALAVGDLGFTRKCIGRIEQFKKAGGTLLFVSHDPGSVVTLCDHAVLIERGELLLQGSPKLVTGNFLKLLFCPPDQYETVRASVLAAVEPPAEEAAPPTPPAGDALPAGKIRTALAASASSPPRPAAFLVPNMVSRSVISYPSSGALIENPRVLDPAGREVNMLVRGERYFYHYEVAFAETAVGVRFGMMIKTVSGVELGGSSSGEAERLIPHVPAGARLTVRLGFDCRLLPGAYFLNAGVNAAVQGERRFLHRLVDACLFRVQDEIGLPTAGFVDFGISACVEDQAGHALLSEAS